MHLNHAARRGFSIVQLLVVLGMLGFLIALLLPALCRTSEQANLIKCASTLRALGSALMMYANENRGQFPRTRFDEADAPIPTFFTHPGETNAFADDGPSPNDVTAALFILMKSQDFTPEVLICPSSSGERLDANTQTISNFPRPENLTYSYCNPYPSRAARDLGVYLTSKMPPDFAIMADINPGGRRLLTTAADAPPGEIRLINSPNHGGNGQNVLYGDSHVEFQTTAYSGMIRPSTGRRDNIYTSGGPGTSLAEVIEGPIADASDSVLLPTAQNSRYNLASNASLYVGREMGVRGIVWVTAGIFAVLAISALVIARSIRNRRLRIASVPT